MMSMCDAVELQQQQEDCVKLFELWGEEEQVNFVTELLGRMCHHQHGLVNQYLKPMLQRDFITALPGTEELVLASSGGIHHPEVISVHVAFYP